MPVLLLAQGDSQAKDLLRSAIESRYGFKPPALQALQLELKGKMLARIGPVSSWLPITVTAQFKLPLAFRWEYTVRLSGMPVRRGRQAYDGLVLRYDEGGELVVETDARIIHSVQKRLWAAMAALLTPLTEGFVTLHSPDDRILEATNHETDDTVQLTLGDDSMLHAVQTLAYNPQADEDQWFKIELANRHMTFDDFILPASVTVSWDDEPYLELEPVGVEVNCHLPDTLFTLEED